MPNILDLLPEFLIGLLLGFLLVSHIINRAQIPYRVTFYFKTSGRKVTCNLSNIETKNNGHTITWQSPKGWNQTMGNITPEEVAAIKVRDRRKSFCL